MPTRKGEVRRVRGSPAFTVVELAVIVAIVGLMAALAITNYQQYVEKARVVRAIAEIEAISHVLDALVKDDEAELPETLAGIATQNDPWGTPYHYLKIEGMDGAGSSKLRKDRFLVPINTDYDLYSMGPDRESVPPLTAAKSRDDIVRANNGAYIGVAELF